MIRPIFRLDTVRPLSFKLFLIRLVPKTFLLELKIFMTARSTFESSLVILLSFLFIES